MVAIEEEKEHRSLPGWSCHGYRLGQPTGPGPPPSGVKCCGNACQARMQGKVRGRQTSLRQPHQMPRKEVSLHCLFPKNCPCPEAKAWEISLPKVRSLFSWGEAQLLSGHEIEI